VGLRLRSACGKSSRNFGSGCTSWTCVESVVKEISKWGAFSWLFIPSLLKEILRMRCVVSRMLAFTGLHGSLQLGMGISSGIPNGFCQWVPGLATWMASESTCRSKRVDDGSSAGCLSMHPIQVVSHPCQRASSLRHGHRVLNIATFTPKPRRNLLTQRTSLREFFTTDAI